MSPARTASVEEIRAHFPALERVHQGQPVEKLKSPQETLKLQEILAKQTRTSKTRFNSIKH
jgi:hypothetical protein